MFKTLCGFFSTNLPLYKRHALIILKIEAMTITMTSQVWKSDNRHYKGDGSRRYQEYKN